MAKKYRYTAIPENGTPYVASKEIQTPAYASAIALVATHEETIVDVGKLTGALSITIDVAQPYHGDRLRMMFFADASDRVVTFSTGFDSAGTLTVTDDSVATVDFVFNSDFGGWVEVARRISNEKAGS